MSDIKPILGEPDHQGLILKTSVRQVPMNPENSPSQMGGLFRDELQKAQAESAAATSFSGQTYIPSTGKGNDKGVHHRLPDGTPVTYDDIRKAIAEGRGDEDVSPYFSGQTNYQALAASDFSDSVEKIPAVAGVAIAVAQRSIFSLLSSITDAFGFGPKVRSALADTEPKMAKPIVASEQANQTLKD